MNYDDIKDMTNEEAVAYFAVITNRNIPCAALENLLGWSGLAKRNAVTGAWEGSMIEFMQSNAVPALCDGLGELFSHLNKPRSVSCDTGSQPWASKMADLLGGLEMVGLVNSQFKTDVVSLGAGYANADLDVAAVQALRDEEAQRVLEEAAAAEEAAADEMVFGMVVKYNELYNTHIAPLVDSKDIDDATWVAALKDMSDNFAL